MGTISLYAPTPYVHYSGSKIFEFNFIFLVLYQTIFFSQPVCFIVQHPRFFFEFLLICNKIQIIMIIEVTSYRWVQCMKMRWKVIRRLIYIIKVGFFLSFWRRQRRCKAKLHSFNLVYLYLYKTTCTRSLHTSKLKSCMYM